ncbi:MAG: efflux RND transporter periplasmic adaptor subunit [Pirellulales bacterium]
MPWASSSLRPTAACRFPTPSKARSSRCWSPRATPFRPAKRSRGWTTAWPLIDLADKQAARDELAATLAVLKTPPREPERLQADLDVRRAQVAKEVAQAALDRLDPLARRGEISEQQVFEAANRVRDAELAEQAADQRRKALLQGPTPEAVHEAETKVARAEAAIAGTETRLKYYSLAAPRVGVINRVTTNPGQWLTVGTLVAELIDADNVLVQVGVPAAEAWRVKVGQTAAVSPRGVNGAAAGEPLAGKVAFVGLEAQAANGLVPVNIRVDNAEGKLRLATVAAADIVVDSLANVLAVPERAVVPSEEGAVVMAVRDGKIEVVAVEIGARDQGLVQVTSPDLREDEVVVIGGAYNLPEGTAVTSESEGTESQGSASSEKSQP